MAYPPSPSRTYEDAEAYELSSYPYAGPSTHARRRSDGPSTSTRPRAARTLTLNSNSTSPNILFSAPLSAGTPERRPGGRRRTISTHGSPATPLREHWANFLDEDQTPDPRNGVGTREEIGTTQEEVHVPDFGHMLGFNPEEEDHFAVANSIRAEWRKRLYLLMEEPRSGREAFFVHIFVTGAILFSVVLTTLSTLPTFHLHPTSIQMLFGLDTTLVVLFTIEYLARCLAHADSPKSFWKWSTSFFPLLDLLAILPYYIEVAREEDTSILFRFTILRTFRLLRVFRAFRYQNNMLLTIEVMYVAVQRSKDALGAISFFILLVLVLFSTLIYFAERGTWDVNVGAFLDADGDPSLFDSIPQTAWFVLATLSTVGYGDRVPRSILGKLLTMPLLLFGLLLIALPSFVLGRNFAIVFDAMTAQTNQKQISESRQSFDDSTSPIAHPPPPLDDTITPHGHSSKRSIDLEAATETDNQPLLPSASNEVLPILPPYVSSNHAGPSKGNGTSRNVSGSRAQGVGLGVRMFDPAEDSLFSTATAQVEKEKEKELDRAEGRDLTNIKLAKNQLVLLEEIGSLRRVIDRQGELLAGLMRLVEAQSSGQGEIPKSGSRTIEESINGQSRIPTPADLAISPSDLEKPSFTIDSPDQES